MKEYESPMVQMISISVDGTLTNVVADSFGVVDLGLEELGVEPPPPTN